MIQDKNKITKKIANGSKTAKKKTIKNNSKIINNKIEFENWKFVPLKSFKEKYKISNHGNVKNIKTNVILKPSLKNGYYYCSLKINNVDKKFRIHRLVALAFVENSNWDINNVVNHIDGNKLNNFHKNLEWTTIGGNNKHAANNNLVSKTKRRICQYDLEGNHIKTYDTMSQAHQEANVSMGAISDACKHNKRNGIACGFIWKYADINLNEQTINPEAEGFKQIKTFPNYWISNDGRIYSKPFKKFMKPSKHNGGTLQIQLTRRKDNGEKGQIKKTIQIHNMVGRYFLKKPKDKKLNYIKHINGDRTDNRVENLEWNFLNGCNTDFNF